MKLNPKFYQLGMIGSVWTILALILLKGYILGFSVDYWILSIYAVFLVLAMLRWEE